MAAPCQSVEHNFEIDIWLVGRQVPRQRVAHEGRLPRVSMERWEKEIPCRVWSCIWRQIHLEAKFVSIAQTLATAERTQRDHAAVQASRVVAVRAF